ncbi:MAG: type 4a pilus biogenesis protein PilO [Candidatus Omnitrophica bacterium]|nr:type 4a pilus biogenesis protein PilO [Candidatus Omnitrophota bacterium]
MLEKMSARERKILVIVIILLIGVGFYHGVYRPVAGKFAEVNDQVFSLQLKIRKAKIFLQQKNDILEESKKYSNLEQMDAGKDEEEIARLLNLIERTARQSGVSLSDVKPQQVKSDKISKRFVVELNAESGVQQIVEFVYELQHSPQLLKIERIETAPKEEKSLIMRTYLVITRVVVL